MPIAYFPYFSTPDPTVKRKSGWLMPVFSTSSKLGFVTVEAPYFWALAPNYDLTLTPSVIDQTGSVHAGRIPPPADERRLCDPRRRHPAARQGRIRPLQRRPDARAIATGAARSKSNGQFGLNQRWVWGWDALLISDKTFYQDYRVQTFTSDARNPFQNGQDGRRVAALPDRPRQPLLFRRAHHLLLRLLRIRPAEAIADHPSGDRL